MPDRQADSRSLNFAGDVDEQGTARGDTAQVAGLRFPHDYEISRGSRTGAVLINAVGAAEHGNGAERTPASGVPTARVAAKALRTAATQGKRCAAWALRLAHMPSRRTPRKHTCVTECARNVLGCVTADPDAV